VFSSVEVWRYRLTAKELRDKHKLADGCTKQLVAAYSVLLAAHECVMCGKNTRKNSWGVPLCSPDCIWDWKFETATPERLRKALNLVLVSGMSAKGTDTKAALSSIHFFSLI
jgi:hypothetical protein